MTSPRTAPTLVVRAHGWVYRRSGGRLGHGVFGAPTLLLGTTGGHSGERHWAPLVYGTNEGQVVVIASNRGGNRPPHWLKKIQADPEVVVLIGKHKAVGCARVIEQGDADFDHLWRQMDEINFGRYSHLQAESTRPMSIVVISRTG